MLLVYTGGCTKVENTKMGCEYLTVVRELGLDTYVQSDLVNPPPLVPRLFLGGLKIAGLAREPCIWVCKGEVNI